MLKVRLKPRSNRMWVRVGVAALCALRSFKCSTNLNLFISFGSLFTFFVFFDAG